MIFELKHSFFIERQSVRVNRKKSIFLNELVKNYNKMLPFTIINIYKVYFLCYYKDIETDERNNRKELTI